MELFTNIAFLVCLSSYAPCEPYTSLHHAGLQQCKQSALFNRLESDWIYAHIQQPDASWFMLLCDGPGILNDVIHRAVTLYKHAPLLKQTAVQYKIVARNNSNSLCISLAVYHSVLYAPLLNLSLK